MNVNVAAIIGDDGMLGWHGACCGDGWQTVLRHLERAQRTGATE
jgi:hypothetical protein